jgi:hypothetical protein
MQLAPARRRVRSLIAHLKLLPPRSAVSSTALVPDLMRLGHAAEHEIVHANYIGDD